MNTVRDLHAAACQAFERAYAPYSDFKVGAAVLDDCGHISRGCNVENVSYPCGTCAEAGAIAAMIAGGSKKIANILIYAPSQTLITPCGACRQRIAEFAVPETVIYLAQTDGIDKSCTVGELLPSSFSEF